MSLNFHKARFRLLVVSLLAPVMAGSLGVCPCDVVSVSADVKANDTREVLRVAADPNDLPFSNARTQGFENEIAALLAKELGMRLKYRFLPQHLGFFRETMKDGDADVVVGVPEGFERCLTTKPYYRSGYVLVTRRGEEKFSGLGDARLKTRKIGVQVTAGGGVPLATQLAQAGLTGNLTGFPVFADKGADGSADEDGGMSKLLKAVMEKRVDAALMWGPPAGYFVGMGKLPLELSPVEGAGTNFGICVGVRRGKKELRDRIDGILGTKADEIQLILDAYNVPRFAAQVSRDAQLGEGRVP